MSEYGSMGHDELSNRAFNGDPYAAGVMNDRQQMEMANRSSNQSSYVPIYRGDTYSANFGPSVATDLFRFKAFLLWGLLPGALYYFNLLGVKSPGYYALAISAAGMVITSGQLRKFILRIILLVILFFLVTQLIIYFGHHQNAQ